MSSGRHAHPAFSRRDDRPLRLAGPARRAGRLLPTDGRLTAAHARDHAVQARERLARDVVGWLTTVARDHRVQSSPISFLHDGADLFSYSRPTRRSSATSPARRACRCISRSDPYGDQLLISEGKAAIDAPIPPLDAHERYRAKHRQPHAHWGIDFV